ncbi:MAG: hypothetical protein AB8I52_07260 [Candidatus Promineifilaceae bacterium]
MGARDPVRDIGLLEVGFWTGLMGKCSDTIGGMNESLLLTVDGIINLILGILLISFPARLVKFLGVPTAPRFYPMILGGVLLGISIALFLERGILGRRGAGLGLDGAVAINLCAGFVLAGLLTFGDLVLPLRGTAFLWALVALLLGISAVEIIMKNQAWSK